MTESEDGVLRDERSTDAVDPIDLTATVEDIERAVRRLAVLFETDAARIRRALVDVAAAFDTLTFEVELLHGRPGTETPAVTLGPNGLYSPARWARGYSGAIYPRLCRWYPPHPFPVPYLGRSASFLDRAHALRRPGRDPRPCPLPTRILPTRRVTPGRQLLGLLAVDGPGLPDRMGDRVRAPPVGARADPHA